MSTDYKFGDEGGNTWTAKAIASAAAGAAIAWAGINQG
jgi:hypothetical protein